MALRHPLYHYHEGLRGLRTGCFGILGTKLSSDGFLAIEVAPDRWVHARQDNPLCFRISHFNHDLSYWLAHAKARHWAPIQPIIQAGLDIIISPHLVKYLLRSW